MFNLQAVILDGTTLTGCKGYNLQRREKFLTLGSDGTVHQTFHGVQRAAPMVQFQTVGVEQLLTALSSSLECPMKTIATAVDFNFAKQNNAAPGNNATGHTGSRIASGHVYLNGLKWSPSSDGLEAGVDVFGISADGTTDPVATIAPTLVTPTPAEVFTLTSLTLGGASVTKTLNFDLSIKHQAENNNESVCYNNGLPQPMNMQVAGSAGPIEIACTIETKDQALAPTTTGTMVAVFTQYTFGGGLSANIITLTINSALIREDSKGATQGSGGTRRFNLMARHDGTNRPLTIVT